MALALLLLFGQFGSGFFPESPQTEGDAALQAEVERLLERQMDINRASFRDLLAIPWLNPFLAHGIIVTRDSLGGFSHLEQVRTVAGMTDETFATIRPFLKIGRGSPTWVGSAVSKVGTDSAAGGFAGLRVLNRFESDLRQARIVVQTEKDRGEAGIFDFASAGVELRVASTHVSVGDFAAGLGQGLVFSTPGWRSSISAGTELASRSVRLLSSAVEGSYLRGAAVTAAAGSWDLLALGSYAGRDAILNEDGTVERLIGSGVHADSASLAGRNAVRQITAGLGAAYRGERVRAGFSAAYCRYDRPFAPADSISSFYGNALLAAGLHAQYELGHYNLGAEVAGSSGPGLAGSFEIAGNWPSFDSRVVLRGRQARFFAPHGRWSGLANGRDRLDASGRVRWHYAGSSLSLGGNTYRDFEFDSVPARLELRFGQELGRFDLALSVGLRFRMEQERSRTARAEFGARVGQATTGRLVLADVYPVGSESRGLLAALLLMQGLGPVEIGLAAARVTVDGDGVTVYLHEPGAGRIGASFSSVVSCWRLAAGCRLRMGRWLRVGVKAGCAWKPEPVVDGAAQLEVCSS